MPIRNHPPDLEARVAATAAALHDALRDAWLDPATNTLGTPSDSKVAQLFYDATRDMPTRTFHIQLARILECARADGAAPGAVCAVARVIDAQFGGGADGPVPTADDLLLLQCAESAAQGAFDSAQWRYEREQSEAALVEMQRRGRAQIEATQNLVVAAIRVRVSQQRDRHARRAAGRAAAPGRLVRMA